MSKNKKAEKYKLKKIGKKEICDFLLTKSSIL
jgi:hypothetical protein